MIENRFRLEKQILLGRQAVRRALHSRGQDRLSQRLEGLPQERIPSPITGTKLASTSEPPSPDAPLPVDTDAETAYFDGPHGRNITPTSGARFGTAARDSHRSVRRRWKINHRANNGASPQMMESSEYRGATPDPPPPDTDTDVEENAHVSNHMIQDGEEPIGFFKRFRTTSIPASFSPFTTLRRNRGNPSDNHSVEQSWSGDSSSDDDLSLNSRQRPSI